MTRYSIEPRAREVVKGYVFLTFDRKYKNQWLDAELDSLRPTSKKVLHKSR